MVLLPTLQVLVLRHPSDRGFPGVEQAIGRALQGGDFDGGYLAVGDDLGVYVEPRVHADTPPRPAAEQLDAFRHTLVVVLVDRCILERGSDALWDWLDAAWAHCRATRARHGFMILPAEDRQKQEIRDKRPGLGALQVQPAHDLGEEAVRPALFALRVLHECRLLLARGLPRGPGDDEPGFLRLFISHAKDELPRASDDAPPEDREVDAEGVWGLFRGGGVDRLAAANGLSRDENVALFHAPALGTATELVPLGIGRLRASRGARR